MGIIVALCDTVKPNNRQQYKFVVVYNHNLQMLEDKQKITDVCVGAGCTVSFYVAEKASKLKHLKNTVIIIDEVDAVLIDKQAQFAAPTVAPLRIIGLTATKSTDFQ